MRNKIIHWLGFFSNCLDSFDKYIASKPTKRFTIQMEGKGISSFPSYQDQLVFIKSHFSKVFTEKKRTRAIENVTGIPKKYKEVFYHKGFINKYADLLNEMRVEHLELLQQITSPFHRNSILKSIQIIADSLYLEEYIWHRERLNVLGVLRMYASNETVKQLIDIFSFPKEEAFFRNEIKVNLIWNYYHGLLSVLATCSKMWNIDDGAYLENRAFIPPRIKSCKLNCYGIKSIYLKLTDEKNSSNIPNLESYLVTDFIMLALSDFLMFFDDFALQAIKNNEHITKSQVIDLFKNFVIENHLDSTDKDFQINADVLNSKNHCVYDFSNNTLHYLISTLKVFVKLKAPFGKSFVQLPDGELTIPIEIDSTDVKELIYQLAERFTKFKFSEINEQMNIIYVPAQADVQLSANLPKKSLIFRDPKIMIALNSNAFALS